MMDMDVLEHLHPKLLPALDMLPQNKPVALVTRHSIREEPKNQFAGYDVPLTALGVELAQAYGKTLSRPIASLFSSPVARCVDTAMAMAQGIGVDIPVTTHSCLVEPGSYVTDLPVAGPYFFKLGALEFAQKHLRNEVRGVLSPEEGARKLLRHLKQNLGSDGTLSVHVTHDTILAAFIYFLRKEHDIDQSHWPWMMEGVFLWFEANGVKWVWRGELGHFEICLD